MIAFSGPGDTQRFMAAEPYKTEDGRGLPLPLPAEAQHTLDQIAAALEVTTALLKSHGGGGVPDDSVRLAEAAELLRAFIRIHDPELRRRCVAFAQQAAGPAHAP